MMRFLRAVIRAWWFALLFLGCAWGFGQEAPKEGNPDRPKVIDGKQKPDSAVPQ